MNTLGMIFPGQGSQYIGMLEQFSKIYPIVKETFSEASSILKYDLWNLVQNGSIKELNKTYNTQPAVLTASVAIWRIWKYEGGKDPQLMAGHSLGEYSALVCSGVINFTDAVRLVKIRSILMLEALSTGQGAMAAIIGLNIDKIMSSCIEASQDQIVSVSSFNGLDQFVISGHKEAVDRAIIICKKFGAKKVFLLPIGIPSHCILMRSIADKLANVLEKIIFHIPQIPVINNVDVNIEQDPVNIRSALVRQLYQPVRWLDILKYLSDKNIQILLEIGPGKILTGLVKRNTQFFFIASAINNPSSLIAFI